MEISHPRRILLLSHPSLPISSLLNILPLPALSALPTASTTPPPQPVLPETLSLKTVYYSADIPLWHDTISNAAEWKQEWLSMQSSGAREVVREVGSVMVVFGRPGTRTETEELKILLRSVADVLSHYTKSADNYGTEDAALLLAVSVPSTTITSSVEGKGGVGDEELEDFGMECGGWEWVDGGVEGNGERGERNKFGEAVGLARIKEALEANDWEGTGAVEGDGEDADPWELGEGQDTIGGDMQAGDEAFSVEVGARTKEMRVPILSPQEHLNAIFNSNLTRDEIDEDDEGDFQVQELERMMLKIQAVKDKGAGMPEAKRKRFAAKAVDDIMKTL